MIEENFLKRPKSGKYLQLRPITGRPKTSKQNKYDIDNALRNTILTFNQDKDTKQMTGSFSNTEKDYKNEPISDKNKFLKILGEEANKETFDNLLFNEIKRMKNINEKKRVLRNINLIEKNYDDLYEWTNLFNNSRPISSYTTLKKQKLNTKENQKIEEFKSPVVLVDLFEEQMNLYFGKNNNFQNEENKNNVKNKVLVNKNNLKNKKKLNIKISNNNKVSSKGEYFKSRFPSKLIANNKLQNNNTNVKSPTHNFIRPMSVYSPRLNYCAFYFSSAFSDYYKEDLKTFSEKMKILKAKVKSNPKKLNYEIRTQRSISSKKEKKLNRLLNMEQFNFGKDNLIIAAERRNPIPLLKSIFKQTYPNKEVMKENIRNYFNTMKPLGEYDGPVDYTMNERWKLSEFIEEIREGKQDMKINKNRSNYHSFTNRKNLKSKNLVLNIYNENDPYIKMLEKMIEKDNTSKNNLENYNEINNKKFYNPILQDIHNNFSKTYKKLLLEEKNENNIEYIKIKNNKKENIKNNLKKNKNNKEIAKNNENNRPKTCYKVSKNDKNTSTRPLTSIFKKYNILYSLTQEKRNSFPDNYIDQYSNFEYTSSNCFPLKTISNVGNASYDKINQMLQERKFGAVKIKYDYFITSTGQIKSNLKNKKYKEEKIILDKNQNSRKFSLSENNKWNDSFNKVKSNKKNKINYYNFDNIKDNIKQNKKPDNFYTLRYFKNLGGKFYSSSNSVNVKNKRKNKLKLLNNFYIKSKYSRDEQEQDLDFVDEAISSQTNSSYQKNII